RLAPRAHARAPGGAPRRGRAEAPARWAIRDTAPAGRDRALPRRPRRHGIAAARARARRRAAQGARAARRGAARGHGAPERARGDPERSRHGGAALLDLASDPSTAARADPRAPLDLDLREFATPRGAARRGAERA